MVHFDRARRVYSQFTKWLLGGLSLVLAGCALVSMAHAQASAISKMLPLGKKFALAVMEHAAATGVVEGVIHIVTPAPAPANPPAKDKPSGGGNTIIFSQKTEIFTTAPAAKAGCVQGVCVGTDFAKLYASPKLLSLDELRQKWNPKSGCDESTDPTQLLGRAVNLDNGIGVPARDPVAAVACYELAAKSGIPLAQYRLSTIYESGDQGVPANLDRADYWLSEAAVRNFPPAQTQLGMNLEEDDTAMAMYWLNQAAAVGEPYALFELFQIYHAGIPGVQPNWQTAFYFLNLSLQVSAFDDPESVAERRQAMQQFLFSQILPDARQGHPTAQLMIANAYELGVPQVLVPNRPVGLCWATRAAQQIPAVWAGINSLCNGDYPRSCPFQPAPC